jgi:manganese efflux pump family protein
VNLFEIALISLALAFNASGMCFAAGYSLGKSDTGIMVRFLFSLVTIQLLFSFAGLLIGKALSGLFPLAIDWIAISLLIMMGIKILYDALQTKPEEQAYSITDFKDRLRMSLAASVDPFIVFSGIGFLLPQLQATLLVAGATFLLFCSAWLIIGRIKGPSSSKFRFAPIGGLILLAAGLHLLIKLIR